MNAQSLLGWSNGLLKVTVPAVLSTSVTVVPCRWDWVAGGVARRDAYDEVALRKKVDLVGLGEGEVQGRASRLIRSASRPSDGGRDRSGAAAREHVFVILPLRVAVAGRDVLERALRKDVGAGRDLDGRVRVVGGVGDVIKGPALLFAAEILPEELVVVRR